MTDFPRGTSAERIFALHAHKGPSHEGAVELRAHLFALEALLRAHIEREERFLLPLLEDAARGTVGVKAPTRARPGQEVPAG